VFIFNKRGYLMYIFKKIIIVATLAMCYVSEGQTSLWGGGGQSSGTWGGGPSSGFMERQLGTVFGGAGKVPKNAEAVCDKAKTSTVGGKLHHSAWFCLKDEVNLKLNQTFADQWKNANCRQYTERNYPKSWAEGSTITAPFEAEPGPLDRNGEPTTGTKMWAVKQIGTIGFSANQLDPSTHNAVCKGIAEQLVFFHNERACNVCKYSTEANAKMAADGQVPPSCAAKKECKAVENQLTYPSIPPLTTNDSY
jgi:hypothetical protein